MTAKRVVRKQGKGRIAALRERRRAEGYKAIEVWLSPAAQASLEALQERLGHVNASEAVEHALVK